jgi:hypothetical protein
MIKFWFLKLLDISLHHRIRVEPISDTLYLKLYKPSNVTSNGLASLDLTAALGPSALGGSSLFLLCNLDLTLPE